MIRVRDPEAARRWLLWWGIALLWWTLDGVTTTMSYHRMGALADVPVTWSDAFRISMLSAWLWVPFTLLALWAAERFPLDRERWRRSVGVHLALAAVVCGVRAGLVVVLNPWVGWYSELPAFPEVLLTSVANNLFLFWMLVGVGHALLYARRARRREKQLVRAELHALKSQLHPHFLFNTLHALSSYVRSEPALAERMIVRLSELLRHVLQREGLQEVTLEEEIRFTRSYLEIEQLRFEERLRVRWTVDPETASARVPHLILQPLVENAIQHGIGPRAAGGTVEITTRRIHQALEITVRDDGVGMRAGAPSASGVGLSNTRARLEQLYRDRQALRIEPVPGGGTQVRVSLPFQAERPAEPPRRREPLPA